MPPGSIIVDLAAERGGNCELSQADTELVEHGVTILGPTNLPSEVPYHASQMYAKNISNFLHHLVTEGEVQFDLEDEITRETMAAHDGQVTSARLREVLKLEPLEKSAVGQEEGPADPAPIRLEDDDPIEETDKN